MAEHDEVLIPGVELLESMRAVGYGFEDAISDLIDNSITAGSRQVDVVCDPRGGRYVSVLDDGAGMDANGARLALKLAGSAQTDRDSKDLGRFGLGLKTASLSQGRRLTVFSRKDGVSTAVQWDLDYVKRQREWRIRVLEESDLAHIPEARELASRHHGTLVVLESLDNLTADAADPVAALTEKVKPLRRHLGLVFHQYLDSRYRDAGDLGITVNRRDVVAADPFLLANSATQASPVEVIEMRGHQVEVQSFVLPHRSKLSATELRSSMQDEAMATMQGFYVYRNHRLIDWGNWYGVLKKVELYKQTRVRVDFPNALDDEWQLDIRKSRIVPPRSVLRRLRPLVEREASKSKRVHTFRGRMRPASASFVPLWSMVADRELVRFEINPEHPSVKAVMFGLDKGGRDQLATLLNDVASSMPARTAYAEIASDREQEERSLTLEELVSRIAPIRAIGALALERADALAQLRQMELFENQKYLASAVERVWKEDS